MNLKNLFTLTIRVEDYNLVAQKPELVKKLRELTIRPTSGMNYELNSLNRIRQTRPVDCKILIAYQNRKMVGWAMLSNEDSIFPFFPFGKYFKASEGSLFEVYINPKNRKQGIASALLKKAIKHTNKKLCVAPHDLASREFYRKFDKCQFTLL